MAIRIDDVKASPPLDYAAYEGAIGLNWYLVDPNLRFQADRYLPPDQRQWAEEQLVRWGQLCGGPIAERAEVLDKNPPQLERYDAWGNEVNRIRHHPAAIESKQDVWEKGPGALVRRQGRQVPALLDNAFSYLLFQSDTGIGCATGMTGGVDSLVARFGSPSVRERFLPKLRAPDFEDAWDGAMFMTEVSGGSDLSESATTARHIRDDLWALNGSKWFCSNVDARAVVTLARPEGGAPGVRGLGLFFVPAFREDGSPNGIRIRRVKDKLGTRSVPTTEIDFVDAEAYSLSDQRAATTRDSSAAGINRMMGMVQGSRFGVAMMSLGIMRRSCLEAAIYAARRTAFGRAIQDHPMVRETLVNMLVELEAAAALCFACGQLAGASGQGRQLYRIMVPLAKFRATRGGLELASQALEMLGGNGYIENWPTARQLRDAQCHTIWEGTENIICLDVRRAVLRERAHESLLTKIDEILGAAEHAGLRETADLVAGARGELGDALAYYLSADEETQRLHARRLTAFLTDVCQAALLIDEAAWELANLGSARKAVVARLFTRRRLSTPPLRGITDPDRTAIDLFEAITRYRTVSPSDAGF